MQKIKSAAIKAAALVHSQKQLRALLGSDAVFSGAGNVTFGGEIAFAQWSLTSDRSKVMTYRINYPSMPDNSFVSRIEADLIAAYTSHEVGHVAYTMSQFTSKLDDKFNPTSINSAPFALALISRAALGDGNGFAKKLLDRIPEPKRSLYKAVADAMPSLSLDRDGTGQALGLAMQFLEGWKAIEPVDQSADSRQPWEQQQSQQPQQSEDDDSESGDSDESFGSEDGDSDAAELAQAEAEMSESPASGPQ